MPEISKLPIQRRSLHLEGRAFNAEARTIELVASTEEAIVSRWWGQEQLMHGAANVVMDRAQSAAGIPLLWGHCADEMDCLLGRCIDFRLDLAAKCTRVTAQFATTEDAQKAMQLIQDGALRDVSIGYFIHEITTITIPGSRDELQQITSWEPAEVSLCSVPADPKAGIGRDAGTELAVRMIRAADSPDCANPECTDPECANPACSGGCSAEQKCSACTDANRSTAPDAVRGTPTTPAAPAGTTRREGQMTPEEIAAAQAAAPTPQDAARNERVESLNLQTVAERSGLGREARELMASSKSLPEIRSELLRLVAERGAQPLPGPGVDMSPKEAKAYSYTRAIANCVAQKEGSRIERGLEEEVAETIEKNLPAGYGKRGGLFVPFNTRSGLDSATSTAGAELKYTTYGGELIELLRNYAAVIGMGARVMPGLSGPVSFPKLTGDATVNWVAENPGSDMARSAPSFSSVTLAAKIMQGAVPLSRSLLNQSVISAEGIVRESLAAGHALAIDKAALHGTGASNQPTGIYKTTSVNTKAMGGVPTFGKLQDMITEVAIDNALMNSLGWLTTPGMAGKLAQTLRASSAGSEMIWSGPYDKGAINGYKAVATNQVSALMSTLDVSGGSEHGIVFGNWNDLLIGFWGALELIVDPYTLKLQNMVDIATFQMADIQTRHPQSFCVSTGATLS